MTLFDLLASEHRELDYAGRPGSRGRPDAGATAHLQPHPQA